VRVKIAIVLVITAVCLVVALWGMDLDRAMEAVRGTAWWLVAPMWAAYLAAHALRAWRLGLLLGTPVPYRRLFAINTIGFLAINVIPLRLGEMVRPYLLAERQGVPFARGLAAIMMERLLDFGALLVLLLGLSGMVELPVGGVQVQGIDVVQAGQRFAGLAVIVGVVGGLVVVLGGEPVVALLERLPAGPRLAGFARRFREGLVALMRRPARALLSVVLTAGVWLVTLLGILAAMEAVPGVPATFGAAWSTWAITLSGMTAVPTPGFVGAYELFCTAALWLWGVDADVARAFAILLHLGQFSFTVGIGAIFMFLEGLSLRVLVRRGAPAPASRP